MAKGDQINFKPHFKNDGPTLPCEGEAGDLYVFSPLAEGDPDPSNEGVAELWFCTKGSQGDGRNAIWMRVLFEGKLTCTATPRPPPQNHPTLERG